MNKTEVDELLMNHDAPTPERSSAAQLRKFHAELGRIRSHGYALDDECVASGLRCIATSIPDEHGEAHSAISIAGPTIRITDARIPHLAELVIAAGQAVVREFGGTDRLRR